MAFALQLRKKHKKTSVRVAGECQLAKSIQTRAYVSIRIHKGSNNNNKLSNKNKFNMQKIMNSTY